MDENTRDEDRRDLHAVTPSLTAAVRRARIEQAEQSSVVAELRGAEFARLEMLRDSLAPVLAQVPAGVDLFDIGIVPGERPRLFIDMIGYVELGPDRRLYRFIQDTRHGRVTIAESERVDTMVDAVTQYIARRLVEREMAMASASLVYPLNVAAAPSGPPPAAASEKAVSPSAGVATRPASGPATGRRRLNGKIVATVMFLAEFVGGVALLILLAGVAYFLWTLLENWWIARNGHVI